MESSRTKIYGTRFSRRTGWDTEESAWAHALIERRRNGSPVFDLTEANPTRCGFDYDPDLLKSLTQPESLRYSPDPFGLRVARQSISAYYEDHATSLRQENLRAEDIMLTASTSEAYSFLFRLLCDPGDEVLVAQPSYPLFDYLAVLDDVKLVPFRLFYDHGWHLDIAALKAAVTQKTRAIVIVHPNNPTGHFTSVDDRILMEKLCSDLRLALIVDEVFLDYSFSETRTSFVDGEHPALTFVLSGLSKVAGLPQMKLAWLIVQGPESSKRTALARLEVIADTFLSVSTPAQQALPEWLRGRGSIQQQIRTRIKANLQVLDTMLQTAEAVDRLEVEGGWYATLRAPALERGEEAALGLLTQYGVAIHPGGFFGMPDERAFVLSLLPESSVFSQGAAHLLRFLNR